MKGYPRSCALSFDIVDKMTEDANTMISQQENKAGCVREMFLDFVKANGIVNDYNKIPKKERLEKFFGYTGSGKAASTLQSGGEKADGKKCRCQFDFYSDDRLTNDALVMLYLHDNKTRLIRELFFDFVQANGIVKNYVDIPEKERLERFFGHVAKVVVPAKQPGRNVKILRDKNIEVRQCYEGTRYLFSNIIYMAPDGKKVSFTV